MQIDISGNPRVTLALQSDGTISIGGQVDGTIISFHRIRQIAIHHEPGGHLLADPKATLVFTTEAPEPDPC